MTDLSPLNSPVTKAPQRNAATGWVIQVFKMSGAQTQALSARFLRRIEDLVVDVAANGPDRFLIIDSNSPDQSASVCDFVFAIDPSARLVQNRSQTARQLHAMP